MDAPRHALGYRQERGRAHTAVGPMVDMNEGNFPRPGLVELEVRQKLRRPTLFHRKTC